MSPSTRQVFGHPAGLFVLAIAQFWERFSFYGILGILVLYLVADPGQGGLGWEQARALKLVGIFSGASFALPFVGGVISSRWLGERRCITIGSLLIITGHIVLATQALDGMSLEHRNLALYTALSLVASGIGFLKPTASSLVARLYPEGGARKDSGFIIFMMCIYAGSFLSFIVVGAVGENVGWDYGFGTASIGMALGYIVYVIGAQRLLGNLGRAPDIEAPTSEALAQPVAKDNLALIFLFSFFTFVFSILVFQSAGLFSLILESNTDRRIGSYEVPVTWFFALWELWFILLGPFATWLNRRMDRRSQPLDVLSKQAIAFALVGLAFAALWWSASLRAEDPTLKTSMLYFVFVYVIFGLADLFIWPVQLSAVTTLAPRKSQSLFVGFWWVAAGAGIFLTGYVANLSTSLGVDGLFLLLTIVCAVAVLVLLLVRPRLLVPVALTRSTDQRNDPQLRSDA